MASKDKQPNRRAETPSIFTYRDAIERGLSPGAMRSAAFDAPTRGLRRITGEDVGVLELFRAYTRLDPGTFLSHTSSAIAGGIWLPASIGVLFPIHLTRIKGTGGHSRRPDVVGHVAPLLERDVRTVGGLALTSPAWTWADLAGTGMRLEDLVAAGDSLLQAPEGPPRPDGVLGVHPLSTLEEIAEVLTRRKSVPGVRLAREALPLLRPGVYSAPESRLRSMLVEEGIQDLEVNVRLHFPDGWSVMPDLVIRRARIAIQYDGDHHRLDRNQYESDIDRDAMLRERGWTVIKVTRTVFSREGRARFLARLRRELLLAADA